MSFAIFLLLIPLIWIFPVYFTLQEFKRNRFGGKLGKNLIALLSPFILAIPIGLVLFLISWLLPGLSFLGQGFLSFYEFEFFSFLPEVILAALLTATVISLVFFMVFRKAWRTETFGLVGGAFLHTLFITLLFTVGPNLNYILDYKPKPHLDYSVNLETDPLWVVAFVYDRFLFVSGSTPEGIQKLGKAPGNGELSVEALAKLHEKARVEGDAFFRENLPSFPEENVLEYLDFRLEKLKYIEERSPKACGFFLFGGAFSPSYQELFLELAKITRGQETLFWEARSDMQKSRGLNAAMGAAEFEEIFQTGTARIQRALDADDLNLSVLNRNFDVSSESEKLAGCQTVIALYKFLKGVSPEKRYGFYRGMVLRGFVF